MDITIERIVYLMEKNGTSNKQLGTALRVSGNLITDWKSGRIKSYKKHLPQIADYFGVQIDYLLGRTDSQANVQANVDEDIAVLIKTAEKMNEEDLLKLVEYAEFLVEQKKKKE